MKSSTRRCTSHKRVSLTYEHHDWLKRVRTLSVTNGTAHERRTARAIPESELRYKTKLR